MIILRTGGIVSVLLVISSVVLGAEPTDPSYVKGNAALDKRDYDQAMNHFNELISRHPNFAWGYFGRATAYRGKKNFDAAIEDYNVCLKMNILEKSNKSTLYHGRGLAELGKRDYDAATADFDEAIRLDPKNENAVKARKWLEDQKKKKKP